MRGSAPSTDPERDARRLGPSTEKDPYRRLGRVYDRLVEPAAGRIRAFCFALWPPRPAVSVLDVGCGTGTHLAVYQRAGCAVSGVDTSPVMLAAARRKLGAHADLRLESGARTSFPDRSFDLITLIYVLHELPADTRTAVLQECGRVVRADGAILVADYQPGPYPFPMGWVYRGVILALEIVAGREHFRNYRHFLAQHGLPPLFETAQLQIAQCRIPPSKTVAVYVLNPGPRQAS